MAIYNNLPGIFLDVLDGQLTIYPDTSTPKFLILGTSDKEPADVVYPYSVTNFSTVKSEFGSGGTLYKTMSEAQAGGAANFVLWRTGADTDGKRKQFEELFKIYNYMYDQPLDVVVPGGVYLDDKNVMDLNSTDAAALAATLLADSTDDEDTLGLFHAKQVDGVWKFAWFFPHSVTNPDITAGTILKTSNPGYDTSALTAGDFHEVNFAYQLAEFCYRGSAVVDTRLGYIGVRDISESVSGGTWGSAEKESIWVGTPSGTNASGAVTSNGSGILGNKFLSGRFTDPSLDAGSQLAAYRPGDVYNGNGGFYASAEDAGTQRSYLDDPDLTDANGEKIDIGKYLNIMGSWVTFSAGNVSYNTSAAAIYAGFASGGRLPVSSAPTNKEIPAGTLLGTVTSLKLDAMAGKRIVGLHRKATGTVISDGCTAATSASDYGRLSTMRQVEACVDGIRAVGEPFLGEGMTGAETAALSTAVGGVLQELVKDGAISSFNHQVIVTPQMKILGQAIVQLQIVPAFELRHITVVVGLSAT